MVEFRADARLAGVPRFQVAQDDRDATLRTGLDRHLGRQDFDMAILLPVTIDIGAEDLCSVVGIDDRKLKGLGRPPGQTFLVQGGEANRDRGGRSQQS